MHLPKLLALSLLAAAAAVPATGQPLPHDAVVATVDDELEVTVADVDGRAERIFYRGVIERPERYRTALHEATVQHLKSLDFFRLGFDQDSAFLARNGRAITEELIVAYYKDRYEEPFLNEDTIQAEYEAMDRAVVYRQILLRKPADASAATLDDIRSTVQEVRRQLDAGADVETLVQRYSEDEAAVRVDGLMPPVTWSQSLKSPYHAVVFQLDPGEVVSLETQDTFVVAVAERVEEVPVPRFEEVYDQIVQVLRGRYSEEANQAFYVERQALVDSVSVRWNDAALAQVMEWSQTPGFYEGDYPEVVGRYLAVNGDAVVFTDSAGELRLSELPRLFREVLTLPASGVRSDEIVRDFLLEAVRADRMAERAEALGLREEILRPDTPSPVLAGAFARYYDQRRVEERLPEPTEAALRAFYDAHADSLFYQLATVYTEVIERETEAEIDEVWAQVQAGVPFEEASSRRLNRSFERTRDGEIVTRFNREPPYLGEFAFELAEGEVAGPVAYDRSEGRHHAIVRVKRKLDERQLAFDEVRERVAEAFLQHHREQRGAEIEAELRARYPVQVDDTLWARVLAGSE